MEETTEIPKLLIQSTGIKLNGKQYDKFITFLSEFKQSLDYPLEILVTGFYINYTD